MNGMIVKGPLNLQGEGELETRADRAELAMY